MASLFVLMALLWRVHTRQPWATVAGRPKRDWRLEDARERYFADEITVDEYEERVADVLDRPREAYTERIEIHVHDAPPGHSLHIHLP